MSAAISVNKLTKRYDNITALSEISFDVHPGEIMGFLGPNGAGKTTTLRILAGILSPTSGNVEIDGLDVTTHTIQVRKRIGYLPEQAALYPELRIQEYLDYRAQIKGVARNSRKAFVEKALEQCSLIDVRRTLIGRLSKGYRQRVALADSLVAQPKILILDEPTVGLDPHQIRQTRELITKLGEHTTILLSTHILPEVEMTCHRVAIINRGSIVAVDTPQQLRNRLQATRIIRVQLSGEPIAIETSLREVPGVVRVAVQGRTNGYATFDIETDTDTDIQEAIFHLAVKQNWTLRELSVSQATLEDVFVHLTTNES